MRPIVEIFDYPETNYSCRASSVIPGGPRPRRQARQGPSSLQNVARRGPRPKCVGIEGRREDLSLIYERHSYTFNAHEHIN